MKLFGFYISRTPPAEAPVPLPLQVLTLIAKPDSTHNFITPGGEAVELNKKQFEVHMDAVVDTRVDMPDGRPSHHAAAGDIIRIDINSFLGPAKSRASLDEADVSRLAGAMRQVAPELEPMIRGANAVEAWDGGEGLELPEALRYVPQVEHHTRTLTLVAQKTVHGDDVFSPLVNAALVEFVAECRKNWFDPDPLKRPKVPMGGAKGGFTASNGVRIDWVASELELPEGPAHG